MLYRGVDALTDRKNNGCLLPHGGIVEIVPLCDGRWRFDGKFNFGPSQSNTVRAHHIESGLYGGCGVSTTRSLKKAIDFATSGNTQDGYIYVIDESRLQQSNVLAYELNNPEHPHEFEVTLIEQSGGCLPYSIVVEKYAVRSDGSRQE